MAFTRRIIDLTFQLGQGNFGADGQDTVTLKGLRCSANIACAGIGYAKADIQVWGMTLDLMNRLMVTQKFWAGNRLPNRVIVSAGDESGVAVCFAGNIWDAWIDARQPPDVAFFVSADSGAFDFARTIPPTSYKGSADAALILSGIAAQIGYSFENSGVTATLTNPYKPGSPKSQIESICHDIGCNFTVDEATKVLAVWPKQGARDGENVRVAADTGLVGYPSFTQSGLQLTSLFNPSIRFGGNISVSSQLESANGTWPVMGLGHRLDSNLPGGEWFTDIECIYPGTAA